MIGEINASIIEYSESKMSDFDSKIQMLSTETRDMNEKLTQQIADGFKLIKEDQENFYNRNRLRLKKIQE